MNYAAIDFGSNALRLAIAPKPASNLVPTLPHVQHFERRVHDLGKDVFRSGEASEATIAQICAIFADVRQIMRTFSVSPAHIIARGTSALRDARNRETLITAIEAASGIRVGLLAGGDEARLTGWAIQASLPDVADMLALDIGGGSTEFVEIRDRQVRQSFSMNVGSTRLLQAADPAALLTEATAPVPPMPAHAVLAATGGSAAALLAVADHLGLCRAADRHMPLGAAQGALDALRPLSPDARMSRYGVEASRKETIVPAAEILIRVAERAGITHIEVPRVGLVYGLLLQVMSESNDALESRPSDAESSSTNQHLVLETLIQAILLIIGAIAAILLLLLLTSAVLGVPAPVPAFFYGLFLVIAGLLATAFYTIGRYAKSIVGDLSENSENLPKQHVALVSQVVTLLIVGISLASGTTALLTEIYKLAIAIGADREVNLYFEFFTPFYGALCNFALAFVAIRLHRASKHDQFKESDDGTRYLLFPIRLISIYYVMNGMMSLIYVIIAQLKSYGEPSSFHDLVTQNLEAFMNGAGQLLAAKILWSYAPKIVQAMIKSPEETIKTDVLQSRDW